MKSQNKAIVASLVVLLLALCTVSGATYSWFTDQTNTEITVSTGKVDIEAGIDEGGNLNKNVSLDGIYALWTGESMTYEIRNTSKVPIGVGVKVRTWMEYSVESAIQGVTITEELERNIAENMVVSFDGTEHSFSDVEDGEIELTGWGPWKANEDGTYDKKVYEVVFKAKEGLDASGVRIVVTLKSEAIQGDAPVWDGTEDISWYNDTDTEFTLTTPEQFAGLSKLVDDGNDFDDKTIKLDTDVDFHNSNRLFNPIGSYRYDSAFKGTFDGQGHTIYNLNQNTWALDNGYYYGDLGLGLFGMVEGATIKNLTMDGANISGESAICGTVAATAYGDCTFENITVSNSNVADYQYYAGGVVGWASGNHQYINIHVDSSTVIAGQWGDFDNSIGGIIGGAGESATILLKDCNVECRIDSYNDVTSTYQWYAYRRAGMLIGNTGKTVGVTTADGTTTYADAPQLTCENVTVTYGDWANYHYCEFAGTSWPYVRCEEGISNSPYSNPRYGHPTDANGNTVVDDDHVHNDGEDHMILCVFDQLYGGGQGVYGKPTHNGVTVIYNNK